MFSSPACDKKLEVQMKTFRSFLYLGILILIIFLVAGCDALPEELVSSQDGDTIQASGVVEAIEVVLAPEVGGTITEIMVQKGEAVTAGDPLFKLHDDLTQAQHDQALAAHEAALANIDTARAALTLAEANLEAANAGVAAAEAQYDLQLAEVRDADLPNREETWNQDTPNEFELPGWYFDPTEQIEAAEAELDVAWEDYENELDNFNELLNDPGNEELHDAEARLAEAQAAFLVAQTLRDRDIGQEGREQVDDYVQTLVDSAESELESAQLEYDQLLTDQEYEDVLEARARVSVAKQRYEIALDHLTSLQTGEHDLSVEASAAGVAQAEAALIQAGAALVQAEAGVTQAEKAIAQTQTALNLAEIQLNKLTVHAPVAGVIMTRNIEVGELARAGSSAMTIGQLEELTVKVYIPESQYGKIDLGDIAELTTNSFPDEVFEATVIRIADKAEYTPRNVQTAEDRATTVFAIELSVDDPEGKLKPGMQVDVNFEN
jgi:multidrug resistance efflux pump